MQVINKRQGNIDPVVLQKTSTPRSCQSISMICQLQVCTITRTIIPSNMAAVYYYFPSRGYPA